MNFIRNRVPQDLGLELLWTCTTNFVKTRTSVYNVCTKCNHVHHPWIHCNQGSTGERTFVGPTGLTIDQVPSVLYLVCASGMMSSTTTYTIAPAAKARAYGNRGSAILRVEKQQTKSGHIHLLYFYMKICHIPVLFH